MSGWNNIARFYGTSGMIIKHIEAHYGKGKTREIVTQLRSFPQKDEGFEYHKHNALYNSQLMEAIEKVLGVDRQTFNTQWMVWIKQQAGKTQ